MSLFYDDISNSENLFELQKIEEDYFSLNKKTQKLCGGKITTYIYNEKTRGETDFNKENNIDYMDLISLNENNNSIISSTFNENNIDEIIENNDFERENENNFNELTKDIKTSNEIIVKFKVEKKKIGREKKGEKKKRNNKTHTLNSRDNMIRKIRIYSIKFGLNLINNCIKKGFGNKTRRIIRGISKEITSDITIDFNLKFFETPLGQIFSNPINDKFKVRDKFQNIKEINKIRKLRNKSEKALYINELLDLKFKEIYDMFVYGNKEENKEKYLKYGKDDNTLNLEELLLTFKNKFSDDYINNLRKEAHEIMTFFDPKNARQSKKKKFKETNFQM